MNSNQKVVMISGATRGIGKAIREKLKSQGHLLSLGARNPADLSDLESPEVAVFHYDANDDDSARQWIQKTADRFGRIDALINNAGILNAVSFEDTPEADAGLDALWKINVRAPFHLIRCAGSHLKKTEGKIINIASLSGKRAHSISAGYAMSKHAVIAMTHSARLKFWEDGVRATAICPGFVNTEMVSHVDSVAKTDMTQPEDVAELVSTVLQLPKNASVSELYVNCRPESQY